MANTRIKQTELDRLIEIIQEQRAENFRLRNVIENLPGSIYWKDKNGIYLGFNAYSLEKLYSQGIIQNISDSKLGKSDYDFFPKSVADDYRKNDLEVMMTGKELVKEEIVTLSNDTHINQLSIKRPLRAENGEIVGIVGNTVDITYLKKIEAELRDAKEKAEIANNIKTEFLRNMEHDIRTPFNGVWGLAHYLWRHEEDPQKKELLANITNCAKELLDHCNGILDYSKHELGSLPILARKFNIRKLIDGIISIESPPAILKELTLSLEYDERIPLIIIGDSYRLSRILINLVSNAIKFTREGYITIKVRLAKLVDKRNIIMQFIIDDTGMGIPPEKQDFIYERFTRISPSNRGIYKGIGLGLRMVKQFTDEMDGEIELQSDLGKGSRFICNLPFKLPLLDEMVDDN